MMATLLKTHVQLSGDNEQPHFEYDNDHNDPEGGSDAEKSDGVSDGEGNDKDGEEGSDWEETEDEDGEENERRDDSNANTGWAEAMAKILEKKTPESKSSILVKNRELDKMKQKEKQEQLERKKQATQPLQQATKRPRTSATFGMTPAARTKVRLVKKKAVDKKRVWEMMCREKPDVVKDRETERALQRTATRGVVQLFNAVRKHQKTIDNRVKDVGGSERKKAKLLSSVSKKDFINVLRSTEGGSGVTGKTEKIVAAAAEENPAWSVLTDDFMMGATMKDWDKDSDREDTHTHAAVGEEESDSD